VLRMKLSELCKVLADNGLEPKLEGDVVEGDVVEGDVEVTAVNTLELAQTGEVSFLANPKYLPVMEKTKASVVIVARDAPVGKGLRVIRCSDPYAAVAVAVITIHGHRKHPQWGISEKAAIHPSAKIGSGANIAGSATIAADVEIGENCTIYPGCYVADRTRIGHDCVLYPNVVIYDDSRLGNRVIIHAGSTIGQDGLGYAPVGDKWLKIPQVGRAVIGDDVEIGANCAVDRATLGLTEVGSGSKLGNAVVIGHGAKVGPDCMFVGLIGVGGSAVIGKHVTLAGQVGVVGHLTVGDGASAGAQTCIMGDVAPGTKVLGTPAIALEQARRTAVSLVKVPEILKRLKKLEKRVADLNQELTGKGASRDS